MCCFLPELRLKAWTHQDLKTVAANSINGSNQLIPCRSWRRRRSELWRWTKPSAQSWPLIGRWVDNGGSCRRKTAPQQRRGSGVRVLFSLLNLVLWCKNSQQEVNGTEEKLQEFHFVVWTLLYIRPPTDQWDGLVLVSRCDSGVCSPLENDGAQK